MGRKQRLCGSRGLLTSPGRACCRLLGTSLLGSTSHQSFLCSALMWVGPSRMEPCYQFVEEPALRQLSGFLSCLGLFAFLLYFRGVASKYAVPGSYLFSTGFWRYCATVFGSGMF